VPQKLDAESPAPGSRIVALVQKSK